MIDAYKNGDPGEAGAAKGEPDAAPKAGETDKATPTKAPADGK